MTSPAERFTPEQVELAKRLAPEVAEISGAYFRGDRLRPFLRGMADGGVLWVSDSNLSEGENVTVTEAKGFRDTLEPEEFPLIDVPEEVARQGLMWVVMTGANNFNRADSVWGRSRSKLDHCFTYWDGGKWITRRVIPGIELAKRPWEERFEPAHLQPAEAEAIRRVVTQTRSLHEIAKLFDDDAYAFQELVEKITMGQTTHRQVRAEFGGPYNLQNYKDVYPDIAMSSWMATFGTVYQQLRHLLPVVHKLIEGRSFELDSGGIQASDYHRASLPSDPETLKKGEDIIVGSAWPPVPEDWLR